MSAVTDAVRNTLPTSVERLLPNTSEDPRDDPRADSAEKKGGAKDVTRPGAIGTRKPEIQQTAKLGGIPLLYDPVLNRGAHTRHAARSRWGWSAAYFSCEKLRSAQTLFRPGSSDSDLS